MEVFEFKKEHEVPKPDYGFKWFMWGKTLEGWGKIRRFYLSHFRREFVREMKGKRRGSCRFCASCCAVMFKCPHLEGNKCTIYENRFEQCGHFPIDKRDLVFRENICGYHFE